MKTMLMLAAMVVMTGCATTRKPVAPATEKLGAHLDAAATSLDQLEAELKRLREEAQ